MKETFQPGDLDALLRSTMQKRPEPQGRADLASIAIQKAHHPAADPALQMWKRINRWNRVLTTVAAIIILSVGAYVLHNRISDGGFQTWSDTTQTSTDTSTTDT